MDFVFLDKAYDVKTKNHGKVTVPANTFEVPVVGSLEEAVTFAGGEDKLVEQYNDAIRAGAKNGGIAIIRNAAEKSDMVEVLKKAVQYVRSFTFTSKISKARILENVDSLKAMQERGELATKTQAELLALLNETLLK